MVRRVARVIDVVGGNMPVLGRQQQVRARTINDIEQLSLISHNRSSQKANPIRRVWEGTDLAGEGVVLPGSGVELDFRGRAELHLRPASDCIETSHLGVRIGGIAGKDGALIQTASQAAKRLASIEFPAQADPLS